MPLREDHIVVSRIQIGKNGRYTATLDPASIAAGASLDLTVAAPGCKTGQAVLVVPPAALLAGLQFSAWVSAADQIKLRLSNTSAGAVDQTSAAWTFIPIGA